VAQRIPVSVELFIFKNPRVCSLVGGRVRVLLTYCHSLTSRFYVFDTVLASIRTVTAL